MARFRKRSSRRRARRRKARKIAKARRIRNYYVSRGGVRLS